MPRRPAATFARKTVLSGPCSAASSSSSVRSLLSGSAAGGMMQGSRPMRPSKRTHREVPASISWSTVRIVRSSTGHNANRMRNDFLDVGSLQGKTGRLLIVDRVTGGWGNIGIDEIVFTDEAPTSTEPLEKRPDFGSFALAVGGDGTVATARRGVADTPRRIDTATGPAARGAARQAGRCAGRRIDHRQLRGRLAHAQQSHAGTVQSRHGKMVCDTVRRRRGCRGARGPEPGGTVSEHPHLGRHLVRLDASPLAARPDNGQHVDTGDDRLLSV